MQGRSEATAIMILCGERPIRRMAAPKVKQASHFCLHCHFYLAIQSAQFDWPFPDSSPLALVHGLLRCPTISSTFAYIHHTTLLTARPLQPFPNDSQHLPRPLVATLCARSMPSRADSIYHVQRWQHRHLKGPERFERHFASILTSPSDTSRHDAGTVASHLIVFGLDQERSLSHSRRRRCPSPAGSIPKAHQGSSGV